MEAGEVASIKLDSDAATIELDPSVPIEGIKTEEISSESEEPVFSSEEEECKKLRERTWKDNSKRKVNFETMDQVTSKSYTDVVIVAKALRTKVA